MVLDTNVLISGLMGTRTVGNRIWELWRQKRFVLLTSNTQLEELKTVTRYPSLRKFIHPQTAGARINFIRTEAEFINDAVSAGVSWDPDDDFLFTIAHVGNAQYLVSADKLGVRNMRKYGNTTLVVPARFLSLLDKRFRLTRPE